MVLNLFIRRSKKNAGKVDIHSSLTHEDKDTPLIRDLGMEINQNIQSVCGEQHRLRRVQKEEEPVQDLHIGFSHHYIKMYGQTSGKLLDAEIVKTCDMSERLVKYDTAYIGGEYAFDKNEHHMIRLVFLGNEQIPFTTFRTVTDEHKERFLKNVGKEFTFNFKSAEAK